jgi:hypothetical protein
VWRRDFTGGTALVNPDIVAHTVALGGVFRKIRGTQVPALNDGSLVTAVTIPARDGIILLASGSNTTPPVTLSTRTRLTVRSVARVRRTLKLTGVVSPGAAPGKVTITKTRLVGKKWRRAGSVKVTVVRGEFKYSFKPTKKGSWRFVATYSGGSVGTTTYTASKSAKRTVKVR